MMDRNGDQEERPCGDHGPSSTAGVHSAATAVEEQGGGSKGCFASCDELRHRSKYAFGVFLIILVAFIWVISSFFIQWIFGRLEFDKPYFLTYMNTTGFALWNVGYCLPSWRRVPYRTKKHRHLIDEGPMPEDDRKQIVAPSSTTTDGGSFSATTALHPEFTNEQPSDATSAQQLPYSLRILFIGALLFCPLWFLANYLFNFSLSKTSVASNTVLSTTSSVWTLLLSRIVLSKTETWKVRAIQLAALGFTIGGATMVALFDDEVSDQRDTLAGDVLSLTSAFFYAAYTTVLKRVLPDDERYRMPMVFGMVGIINFVLFWPGLLILNRAGVERFELPPGKTAAFLAINSIIGTNLSDVLWAKSVVLTSPFVATMGLSLTIPIAMLSDIIVHGKKYTAGYIAGAVFLACGFTVSNSSEFPVVRRILGIEHSPQQEAVATEDG